MQAWQVFDKLVYLYIGISRVWSIKSGGGNSVEIEGIGDRRRSGDHRIAEGVH